MHADEAASWDNLHDRFEVKRINHQEAYSLDGACTSMAEEYFSRLRRAEIGIRHHIGGAYLLRYAQESSWREDNRRISNGNQVNRIASLALKRGRSVDFTGYWQRHIADWSNQPISRRLLSLNRRSRRYPSASALYRLPSVSRTSQRFALSQKRKSRKAPAFRYQLGAEVKAALRNLNPSGSDIHRLEEFGVALGVADCSLAHIKRPQRNSERVHETTWFISQHDVAFQLPADCLDQARTKTLPGRGPHRAKGTLLMDSTT